jgi:type IV secretory pathway TrbD component
VPRYGDSGRRSHLLLRGERGQASVELVAVVPIVLLIGAIVWQLALTGHTAWLTAHAARAAARADAVGRDARAAARSALPASLESELEVDRPPGGGVRVSVRVPLLLRGWRTPVRVMATSSLRGDR